MAACPRARRTRTSRRGSRQPSPTRRLLAVIESAFGDFRFFNQIVRREFAAANERLEQKSQKNLLSAERLPAVSV